MVPPFPVLHFQSTREKSVNSKKTDVVLNRGPTIIEYNFCSENSYVFNFASLFVRHRKVEITAE